MNRCQEIERSIIKKFRPTLWHPFVKAINDYKLIDENDKIAVCISGGKDSFLLAKCLEELQKHGKVKFDLEYIIMNPGYTDEVLDKIKNNLKLLNIDAHIFESPIFKVNYAREIGCNKIALGHHYDDVLETILMNLIYNGMFAGMMPKLKSDNFEGMELIRPLYLVREDSILDWSRYNKLSFIDCACSVTKKNAGKRKEMKTLIKMLKEYYDDADRNLFNSLSNVKLDKVITYIEGNKKHNFLDKY